MSCKILKPQYLRILHEFSFITKKIQDQDAWIKCSLIDTLTKDVLLVKLSSYSNTLVVQHNCHKRAKQYLFELFNLENNNIDHVVSLICSQWTHGNSIIDFPNELTFHICYSNAVAWIVFVQTNNLHKMNRIILEMSPT